MNTTLFPFPYTSVYCDVFNCQGMVKWFIGRADGPMSTTFKVCDGCARHLLSHVPESLLDALTQFVPEPVIEVIEEPAPIIEPDPEPEPEIIEPETVAATVEVQPEEPTMIYRCLDCNAEFADNRGLSNHKRIKHKE